MGRPRLHGQQTAAALLAAAERVAETQGPAAMSVRRVAEEVGTTTRAVYTLFGSKDGLLVALATHGFRLLAADVAALPETSDPLEDLVAAGSIAFRQLTVEHPVLFRISFQRESVTPELASQFDGARRAALTQLTSRLERLKAAGGLHDQTPAEAALYFHSLCEGLAAVELRGALPRSDAQRHWRSALRALLVGFGAEPRARPGALSITGEPDKSTE